MFEEWSQKVFAVKKLSEHLFGKLLYFGAGGFISVAYEAE